MLARRTEIYFAYPAAEPNALVVIAIKLERGNTTPTHPCMYLPPSLPVQILWGLEIYNTITFRAATAQHHLLCDTHEENFECICHSEPKMLSFQVSQSLCMHIDSSACI